MLVCVFVGLFCKRRGLEGLGWCRWEEKRYLFVFCFVLLGVVCLLVCVFVSLFCKRRGVGGGWGGGGKKSVVY